MSPIDHLSWEEQDRLYGLRADIRIGEVSDWPADAFSYIARQTHDAARYVARVSFMIELSCHLANLKNAHLFCRESTDSRGDHWILAHKDWKIGAGGEQAA
jgi:hypothetical protein